MRLLLLLALPLIASCTNGSKPGAWHFSGFSEVRAFRLNWEDKHSFDRIINQDGSLNDTRLPEAGIILTDQQVSRLEAAVTGTRPEHPVADCFYPHHAFVFYNESGEIIGHLNICFLCSNYSGEPSGFAASLDFDKLAKIVTDIGMPLRNPNWD